MQLQLTAAQRSFRDEVREFLAARLPAEIAEKVRFGRGVSKEDLGTWTRLLDKRGWAAPNWPVAHGGTGWSLIERHLFDVECRRAHAPPLSGFGFNMVGPAIIKFGTAAQQQQFLPQIRNAELWWCQGYSEPQAGSDLASVRTRADRGGDHYVVNGSKIWTSAAESADWIFALVRTDAHARPQRGISFLLIDMSTPGVSVEPLYALNGKTVLVDPPVRAGRSIRVEPPDVGGAGVDQPQAQQSGLGQGHDVRIAVLDSNARPAAGHGRIQQRIGTLLDNLAPGGNIRFRGMMAVAAQHGLVVVVVRNRGPCVEASQRIGGDLVRTARNPGIPVFPQPTIQGHFDDYRSAHNRYPL